MMMMMMLMIIIIVTIVIIIIVIVIIVIMIIIIILLNGDLENFLVLVGKEVGVLLAHLNLLECVDELHLLR